MGGLHADAMRVHAELQRALEDHRRELVAAALGGGVLDLLARGIAAKPRQAGFSYVGRYVGRFRRFMVACHDEEMRLHSGNFLPFRLEAAYFVFNQDPGTGGWTPFMLNPGDEDVRLDLEVRRAWPDHKGYYKVDRSDWASTVARTFSCLRGRNATSAPALGDIEGPLQRWLSSRGYTAKCLSLVKAYGTLYVVEAGDPSPAATIMRVSW